MWKSQKQLISWIHESFYFKFVNFLIGKICFVKVSSFKTHWTLYISNSQILKKLIQDGRVQNRKKIVQSTFIKKIRKIIFRFHQFCFVSTSLNLTSCFLANDYLIRTIIVTCFGWSQKQNKRGTKYFFQDSLPVENVQGTEKLPSRHLTAQS